VSHSVGNGKPFTSVRYDMPLPGVARVTLARPDCRNAQDKRLLYEVNDAFDLAAQDDAVKVVILAAEGPHFSAGHDLADFEVVGGALGKEPRMTDHTPVGCWGGFDLPGVEGWMAMEEEVFLGLCWRWRNLPKPTIASVQGKAIAGGLMLVWVCDLIVAAENAQFSDPVVAFGMNGHEFFVHTWELGARRAKEMLFMGSSVSAQEAYQLGMVNRVVPTEQLEDATLAMAERIAAQPSIGLKLAKQAVNQSLDAQGQWTALQAAFSIHETGHAHNMLLHGRPVDPAGVGLVRKFSAEGPPA